MSETEKIRKKLKKCHYSDEAINEILKWYA